MQSYGDSLTAHERLVKARTTQPSGRSLLCVGFYPTQSMWVGKQAAREGVDTSEIAVLMHEPMRCGSHDDFMWFITHDGLVAVHLSEPLLLREGIISDVEADDRRMNADGMYAGTSQTGFGRKWSLYLDYLNALHLLLAAARDNFLQSLGIKQFVGEITLANAIVLQHCPDDPLHRSVPQLCQCHWAAEDGSVAVMYHPLLKCQSVLHTRADRPVLPTEKYDVLDSVHRQLVSCSTDQIRLLAMVARAIHAYQQTSYDTCLILLWTVIENLINKRFDSFMQQAAQPTTTTTQSIPAVKSTKSDKKKANEKKSKQKQHKDISSQINTLHDNHRLPTGRPDQSNGPLPIVVAPGRFKVFIDLIRQARNDFVHNAKPCHDEHCDKAYAVLEDLVTEDWHISLPLMHSRPMINIARKDRISVVEGVRARFQVTVGELMSGCDPIAPTMNKLMSAYPSRLVSPHAPMEMYVTNTGGPHAAIDVQKQSKSK